MHDDEPCPIVDARGLVEEKVNVYAEFLIDRFYVSARHEQVCQMSFHGLQRHDIELGAPFALAVYDAPRPPFKRLGYVCQECMDKIANGRGE